MMNFKLSFDDPKFFVNEKKGIVTCVMHCYLKGTDWALVDMANRVIGDKDNPISHGFTVTATANTDPQDTFDVEIGKKVSRAKAESMAYSFMSKSLTRIVEKYCCELAEGTTEFIGKAIGVIEHNNRYISQF